MPASEKQLKILAFPYSKKYRHLICDGAIRSGKSSFMSVSFVEWAMREFNGQNLIILGFTIGSVLRNVIDPLMAMAYMKRRYKMRYNSSKSVLVVERDGRRNQFMVFGADTKRSFEKIQGLTAAGCLVDEVALCDKAAFDMALSRCSVKGSRYFFNCNPDNPNHWFHTDWVLQPEKHNALHLHFMMDDNPSLDGEIKEQFENQYHGVFYDRYIRGLWVVAEGLVYQFDSPDDYTCTKMDALGLHTVMNSNGKEREELGGGEWFVSIDYGITNPFAALLWRVTADRAYIVDEYYFDSRELGYRRTDEEHYQAVERLIADYPVMDMIVDPSANSFKEVIWRRGRFSAYDADNSVIDGIQVTDQMLHDGSLKICDGCENTLKEMQLYRWDDKALNDAVIKESDHAMDAMRYGAMTKAKYLIEKYF